MTHENIISYLKEVHGDGEEEEGPGIIYYHYIETLDAPRDLPDPVDLTLSDLTTIVNELGLIHLCWPNIESPRFEDRTNFPETYLKNNNKEKLLLLFTENFRRQFAFKYPGRKQLFLASANECGLQKMVCNTLRPTLVSYPELESWESCAKFIGSALRFEPYELPTLIPNRFYSPHTVFMRRSGQPHEIASILCSLLIGLGYDAYIVFGYAVRDVTLKILTRVESPYPPVPAEKATTKKTDEDKKYKIKPPRDLTSKFLQAMEQKQRDKEAQEQQAKEEEERLLREEEEKPPFDELDGIRYHFWVLIRTDGRMVDDLMFLEPSTGVASPIDNPNYTGIEAVWNHLNYWVNMQSGSPGTLDYNLRDVTKWEHLLLGEPIFWRETGDAMNMDDEELELAQIMEEKHLDMPVSWSTKLDISHKALKQRFPDGVTKTWYKRTLVEEYAPYVQFDGLVAKITRYSDFNCTECVRTEEHFENREDHLVKIVTELQTDMVIEHFERGREDAVVAHTYSAKETSSVPRIIQFNALARHDGLYQLEVCAEHMVEEYLDREDHFCYREVFYATKGFPPPGFAESHRQIIVDILEKFNRDSGVLAADDIATKAFHLVQRTIDLKYHFGEGKVTASTRNFKKPAIAETGEDLMFTPELSSGYEADVLSKPPTQLKLYLLFQKVLRDEVRSITKIREVEDQIAEFLSLRDHELAFPKLKVSLFNIEQNEEYRQGMLEKEKLEKQHKEREVEDGGVEYLKPYLNKVDFKDKLSVAQAQQIRFECLKDFKTLLLNRALDIQKQFEYWTQFLEDRHAWYNINQDSISDEDEAKYFQELNDLGFLLQCFEIRLQRHKDLSGVRYDALMRYLNGQLVLLVEE